MLRNFNSPSTATQISPVRACVPTGIRIAEKLTPIANSRTIQPGRNTVPYVASQNASGMVQIDTVEMIDPS